MKSKKIALYYRVLRIFKFQMQKWNKFTIIASCYPLKFPFFRTKIKKIEKLYSVQFIIDQKPTAVENEVKNTILFVDKSCGWRFLIKLDTEELLSCI